MGRTVCRIACGPSWPMLPMAQVTVSNNFCPILPGAPIWRCKRRLALTASGPAHSWEEKTAKIRRTGNRTLHLRRENLTLEPPHQAAMLVRWTSSIWPYCRHILYTLPAKKRYLIYPELIISTEIHKKYIKTWILEKVQKLERVPEKWKKFVNLEKTSSIWKKVHRV